MIALVTPEFRVARDKAGALQASVALKTSWATCLVLAMCLAADARVRAVQRRNVAPILRYDLEITLEEAANGMTAQLRIPRLETCETCKGPARRRNATGKLQHLWWHRADALSAGILFSGPNLPRLSRRWTSDQDSVRRMSRRRPGRTREADGSEDSGRS